MTRVGNVMILASAGSGKTYALTNRFVRLLALGAAPERIVALTFTRKAAGEFFDEILNKLARAASEQAYASQLAREIGWTRAIADASRKPSSSSGHHGVGCRDFLQLLRAMVEAMPRLRLGTIDGFFARIARSFPLELGLAGEFELLEEHAARMERSRVLRRIFERTSGRNGLTDAQREFVEAFKRATFGVEEKRLGAQLDEFLDRHQEVFLAAPQREAWGNAKRIWPDGGRWVGEPGDIAGAIAAMRSWLRGTEVGDKQRGRWVDFLAACEEWAPGATPPAALVYVLQKVLGAWPDIEAGQATFEFDRKRQFLSGEASAALAVIARHVVSGELNRRLEITRGIHAVLSGYEAVYHDAVRRAGRLTFADVQRLLMPESGAPRLSSHPPAAAGSKAAWDQLELDLADAVERSERRLLIDFRLDGEIDHWLLDEFQDTSYGQWSVLRNLIDEVVQDPTGTRSFFYVGDVKQAIFAWREGDARLFREIFDYYNGKRPGAIAEEHLVESWRSGPAIIDTVNRVFGDGAALEHLFPGAVSRAWNEEWRDHATAKPQLGGHVAVLHAGGEKDRSAQSEEARFGLVLALLEELEPLARGLSCAVLVQKNNTATALADYLRQSGGLDALAESDLHVCTDNPLGAALLALAKAAAYPGDTLAWEHVAMTPLREVLAAEELHSHEQVTLRLLAEIHAQGFERTMAGWARRLETKLPADDTFTRERARQFAAAAGLFDLGGSRDVAEFIAFMERHTVRDAESSAVIRVMTIHKSKGLGFDLVILPDLEGQRLDCRREGLAVQRGPDRAVEWVLDLPGKLMHECDEVLAGHVRAAEADSCYEALSLLYVAMTRAKRAMYLVIKPPGDSSSRNFPRLLASTLGEASKPVRVGRQEYAGSYSAGDPNWHVELRAEPEIGLEAPAPELPVLSAAARRTSRLVARRPSETKAARWSGLPVFALRSTDRTAFGTTVHRLLAEVLRIDQGLAASLAQRWRERGEEHAAVAEAQACLEAPLLGHLWAVDEQTEVWRERGFEVVLDGTWISGVFDRVLVERGPRGRPTRVSVFDFKTDRAEAPADLRALVRPHVSQLELYRRVAALLTGLPTAAVTSEVVFTALGRAVSI